MAEFPILPLHTDALLGDIQHLTTTEVGAYTLLIIVAWRDRDCSLPNDEKQLRQITRLHHKQWARSREKLLAFWVLGEDGRLRQKKLTATRTYTRVRTDQKRTAARARWLKTNGTGDAVAYAAAMESKSISKESESRPAAVLLSSARATPVSPASPPAPPEVAAAVQGRFSGEGLHPDYGAGIEVLERRLGLPAMLAWKPLNDWLQGGASLELVLGAITRVTQRERGKDPAWQPRTLAYFADAVTRAKLGEAVGPVPVNGVRWTGYFDGTQVNAAARAGLKVVRMGPTQTEWMKSHGFTRVFARHPDVQAVAKAEGVYLETERD